MVATISSASASQRLEISKVAARTFDVIGRHFVPFAVMILLLSALPRFLFSWWQLNAFGPSTTGPAAIEAMAARAPFTILMSLVDIALGGVLQAAIVYGSVRDLNGERPSVGELLSAGLRFALPAVAIGLIFGIMMFVGTLALVVPGMMIAVAWLVALPSAVVERTGVFGAFSRSAQLTRGSRWRIFLLLVIFFVVVIVAGLLVSSLSAAARGGSILALDLRQAPTLLVPQLIFQAVVNVGVGLLSNVGIAVTYQELRTMKEGVAPSTLAAVFD